MPLVRKRRWRWEFWFFLELLSCWRQHEQAPPVFDSAAVTYHRAQQFVNKSKPLPWACRAMAFVFKSLCSVPFLCCALVIQALAKTFALVIYTTGSFDGNADRTKMLIRLPSLTGWTALGSLHPLTRAQCLPRSPQSERRRMALI